jgi:four helix bundle protein
MWNGNGSTTDDLECGRSGMKGIARETRVQPLRERTKAYALRIIKVYRSLPRTTEAQVIGKQLLRSGTSVGANYREGYRARSDAEMLAKFGICIQELDESAYWMELLIESEIVKASALTLLLDEANQLIAIFTASVKRIAADE